MVGEHPRRRVSFHDPAAKTLEFINDLPRLKWWFWITMVNNHNGSWDISRDKLWDILWEKVKNHDIRSGKRLHNYGKSPLFMGKLTTSMVIFHSYVSHYQRVSWCESRFYPIISCQISISWVSSPYFAMEGFCLKHIWNCANCLLKNMENQWFC